MKNKKVLVTGVAGFLGSHLADKLLKKKNFSCWDRQLKRRL